MTSQLLEWICALAGLGFTMLLGLAVEPLLTRAGESIPLLPPRGADEHQQKQWDELCGAREGGEHIGRVERLMFYAAFLANAPLAVGAWLAFKVASKWNVWDKVISVPSKIEGDEKHASFGGLDFLIARRSLGSHMYMTFLLGTAYNILAALLGIAFARCSFQVIQWVSA